MPNLSNKGWAYVVELKDSVRETEAYVDLVARNPMVDPSQPALYAGWCFTWPPHKYPDDDFSESKNSLLRHHGLRLLEDLRGNSRSMLRPLLGDVEERVYQLSGRGHAVFSPKRLFPALEEPGPYSVYIIHLPDAAKEDAGVQKRTKDYEPDEAMPCVYVGETLKHPEERLQQHVDGEKYNRFVKRYGGELVPLLYEHLSPRTRLEALREESRLVRRLRGFGYWVLSG